jgi:rSAM/selenodomain-associated transferase 2
VTSPLSVSIVVPVLHEATTISTAVARLVRDFPDCELVVVDGGSTDGTADIAGAAVPTLVSGRGRARQMNAGAAATRGEVLWFVHADTVIDPAALAQLRAALVEPRVVGGGLSLRFDRRCTSLDLLARSSTARARRLHQVFGDQAMFVRRSVFDELGGFPDLPLMEDLEFSRRLHRRGRLVVLPATSTASARRFVEHGTVSMILFMQLLKLQYFAGRDPTAIARQYRRGPPWNAARRTRRTGPIAPSLEETRP